ncbi:tRNA-specific adenosine deaminase [Calycina marina]|uniref:tRNA-specific adenosine deaminase n=1 Tax=Calycina marina TaxID=1763456 RepID=A0A9P7YXU9_9HELO|nr:tRNA-specific adenosine deaminase [Calycina marina]
MEVLGDDIALTVLQKFDSLPTKAKPLNRGNGMKEWVPLSGIVASSKHGLTCLALATGMKCLPQNKISQAQGIVLHDWHAEILAIRSFNRFLLDECLNLATAPDTESSYLRFRNQDEISESHFQPFTLKADVSLHMYCSEAPCGDASMELTMAAQEDDRPWQAPVPATTKNEVESGPSTLQGRSYFSALGIVRRKPSRPDAPPTLSKSCSDKLSMAQATSLLSSLVSLLVSPTSLYLKSLTLPSSQHSPPACGRAFSASGRLSGLSDVTRDGGYAFRPFEIITTNHDFKFSRRQTLEEGEKLFASNVAASWISSRTSSTAQTEVLIGGFLQGRKKLDILGASRASRRSLWKLALQIATIVAVPKISGALSSSTYREVKASDLLGTRRRVKEEVRRKALQGWIVNVGDDEWIIDGAIRKNTQ